MWVKISSQGGDVIRAIEVCVETNARTAGQGFILFLFLIECRVRPQI